MCNVVVIWEETQRGLVLNGDPVLSWWWGCEILLTRYVPSWDVSEALNFTYFFQSMSAC